MPREEHSAQLRAQLEALDRILAREPVGEEHLELAALVDSVRANAPAMDAAFAARLDAQVRTRPTRLPRLPRVAARRVALAGGGLAAAAVALTVVLSSGLLGGAARVPASHAPLGNGVFAATPASPSHAATPASPSHAATPASPSHAATPASPSHAATPASPSRAAAGTAAPAPSASAQLVQRSSMLVLASPPGQLQRVANEVIAQTERAGGVVASSYVNDAGAASRASFTLRVPGAALPPLIAALSGLASVRSLTQDTVDITASYRSTLATLATLERQRATLEHELAIAPSSAAAAALTHRLDAVEADIAAQRASAAGLLAQGRTATLHVRLSVATTQARGGPGHGGGGAGGRLGRAAREALAALEDVLAVALVALAIMLPVALSVLVVWWLWTALRSRARERALAGA